MSDGMCFGDLTVGMKASFGTTNMEADVMPSAAGRITEGLGIQQPGPGTIPLSQSLTCRAPVRIGETAEVPALPAAAA